MAFATLRPKQVADSDSVMSGLDATGNAVHKNNRP
jgi:hypothetical protein